MASTNIEAEAYAFRALVAHLQAVSEQASNIDVMNASGLCRNCLSKWYHAGTHAVGRTSQSESVIYKNQQAASRTTTREHRRPSTFYSTELS